MTKIVFTRTATNNLIEQAKYILKKSQNKKISDKFLDEMKCFIVNILSNFPKSGRPSEDLAKDTRKLVYKGYSIIYKIDITQIYILSIYKENIPKL